MTINPAQFRTLNVLPDAPNYQNRASLGLPQTEEEVAERKIIEFCQQNPDTCRHLDCTTIVESWDSINVTAWIAKQVVVTVPGLELGVNTISCAAACTLGGGVRVNNSGINSGQCLTPNTDLFEILQETQRLREEFGEPNIIPDDAVVVECNEDFLSLLTPSCEDLIEQCSSGGLLPRDTTGRGQSTFTGQGTEVVVCTPS